MNVAFLLLTTIWAAAPGALEKGAPVELVLPDYVSEVKEFAPAPPAWSRDILNVLCDGPRESGASADWLARNELLVDACVGAAPEGPGAAWRRHRGLAVDGSAERRNGPFPEAATLKLFETNGLARDSANAPIRRALPGGARAYAMDLNAPHWSAAVAQEWTAAALLGDGVFIERLDALASVGLAGPGDPQAYCNWNNLKFFHHLRTTGRLPEFRQRYQGIRDYIAQNPSVREGLLGRDGPGAAERKLDICRDPVLAEYQLFRHLSQLHNLVRYYRDAKLVAGRAGREVDLHGGLGGSGAVTGGAPGEALLGAFLDAIGFDTPDTTSAEMILRGQPHAYGPFRFDLGQALSAGQRPVLAAIAPIANSSPDLLANELAEQCAGGGAPMLAAADFAVEPELAEVRDAFLRFRQEHRAVFERGARTPYAQVAVAYSVPTLLYTQYEANLDAPPTADLAGVVRALKEWHIPFEVVLLSHPDIRPSRLSLEELRRFRLVILPSVWSLADTDAEVLEKYALNGGLLATVGEFGLRDETNRPREVGVLEGWARTGKARPVLADRTFGPLSAGDRPELRARRRAWAAEVARQLPTPILKGDLPPAIWVTAWRHPDGFVSVHFVNYDFLPGTSRAAPMLPNTVELFLPPDIPAEEAAWLTPGRAPQSLPITPSPRGCRVALPATPVYGVLLVGKAGLDAAPSLLRAGQRCLQRARMACGGEWGELKEQAERALAAQKQASGLAAAEAFCAQARDLLRCVADQQDRARAAQRRAMADTAEAVSAFAFGARAEGWKSVQPETAYSAETGFGWLAPQDASTPAPDEGAEPGSDAIAADGPPPGAEAEAIPAALRGRLRGGRAQRFRIDLPEGLYRVRLIGAAGAHGGLAGMVAANGLPALFDAPIEAGEFSARSFTARTQNGALVLTFGGAAGWCVAAAVVSKAEAEEADPLAAGGIREWLLSPRFANAPWWPIYQVRAEPEKNPVATDTRGWTPVKLAAEGLPVADLGTLAETEVGDVVCAQAILTRPAAGKVRLSLGSSSAAELYVNGKLIAYLPNQRGLLRDEAVVEAPLEKGRNILLLKLCRFWERRWMFYAAVTAPAK